MTYDELRTTLNALRPEDSPEQDRLIETLRAATAAAGFGTRLGDFMEAVILREHLATAETPQEPTS